MSDDISRSIVGHLYQITRYLRPKTVGEAGTGGLTLHQLQAVRFIKQHQPVKMGELADELHISPGSATLLANRLIEAGWLTRRYDAQDRRTVYVELSKETNQKFETMMKRRMEQTDQILGHLSQADLRELDRILQTLLGSLAAESDDTLAT